MPTTTSKPPQPQHLLKSERTRDTILRKAVAMASVQGLEGLSIGELAEELEMSKSGLFAHFGSKEDLQLATIEMAREIFREEVVRPALKAEAGIARLWSLCEAWFAYAEARVFPGGCFFTQAAFEFDSRIGPVRDRIAESMQVWLATLSRAVEEAQRAGHLDQKIDAKQLAFEINSLKMGAIWASQLLDDTQAYAKVKMIVRQRLQELQTKKSPPLPPVKSRKVSV